MILESYFSFIYSDVRLKINRNIDSIFRLPIKIISNPVRVMLIILSKNQVNFLYGESVIDFPDKLLEISMMFNVGNFSFQSNYLFILQLLTSSVRFL